MKTEDVVQVLEFVEEAVKQYTEKNLVEAVDTLYSWSYDTDGWIWLHFQDEDGENSEEWLRIKDLVEWANKGRIK